MGRRWRFPELADRDAGPFGLDAAGLDDDHDDAERLTYRSSHRVWASRAAGRSENTLRFAHVAAVLVGLATLGVHKLRHAEQVIMGVDDPLTGRTFRQLCQLLPEWSGGARTGMLVSDVALALSVASRAKCCIAADCLPLAQFGGERFQAVVDAVDSIATEYQP